MLAQHQYYLYHDGPTVYARMEDKPPVKMQTFKDKDGVSGAAQAYEYVQSVLNPERKVAADFKEVDKLNRPLGFLSREFQDKIAERAEPVVRKAYGEK